MPKRRDLIAMSEAERFAFLESRKSLSVATLNADGSPHLTVLWYGLVDGKIVIETYTKSQKIKNLERDPRIAVMAESGTEYKELRGVSIRGRAELSRDPETVRRLHSAVLRRNTDLDEATITAAAESMLPKKTVITVHPERIMSWDHSKLEVDY